MNQIIFKNMQTKVNYLTKFACQDSEAQYLKPVSLDFRGTFFRDIDKIIYSLSFVRYNDKTQVFSFTQNSHLTKRGLHVQLVSKIARTIARGLGLNEDLTEAIALGHDLGHAPFGHLGERILNRISLEHHLGYFNHNVHSVRLLREIENYGQGLNISLQVLDGIMCHNGEIVCSKLTPRPKTWTEFDYLYSQTYFDSQINSKLKAGTLEGCIVRISDVISYLGRDIEDGIRMGLITSSQIPASVVQILGSTTSTIIDTIVCDIINQSLNHNYIKISTPVFKAIQKLKQFNEKNIYFKANDSQTITNYDYILTTIYNKFLNDLKQNNQQSVIYSYLNSMTPQYQKNSPERIVLDYVAGMTDEFVRLQYQKLNVIEK